MELVLIVWGAKQITFHCVCLSVYLSLCLSDCLSLIFPSVCSVWHEWVIENDTYTGMYYTMGETCSTSDREAKVRVVWCGVVTYGVGPTNIVKLK